VTPGEKHKTAVCPNGKKDGGTRSKKTEKGKGLIQNVHAQRGERQKKGNADYDRRDHLPYKVKTVRNEKRDRLQLISHGTRTGGTKRKKKQCVAAVWATGERWGNSRSFLLPFILDGEKRVEITEKRNRRQKEAGVKSNLLKNHRRRNGEPL